MSKQLAAGQRKETRLSIAIEYVGIIVIVCLFAGALVGRYTAPTHGRPTEARVGGAAAVSEDAISAALDQIQRETDHDKLVEIGNNAYDSGIPAVAIHAYEKALTYQPNDPNVLSDLAAMYLKVGQSARAVELTRRATSIDKEHPGSWLWLGNALEASGDKEGARRAFQEVLKVAPDSDFAKDARRLLAALDKK